MKTIYKCIICGTEHSETICPSCGARADIGIKEIRYCPNCGMQCMDALCPLCGTATVAGENSKKCLRCGKVHDLPACPYCGYTNPNEHETIEKVVGEVITDGPYGNKYGQQGRDILRTPRMQMVPYRQKSKKTAMILCALGGWLGLHRLYTGKIVTGLLYMRTKGFFGVGILLDFLSMIKDTYRDSNGNPLR